MEELALKVDRIDHVKFVRALLLGRTLGHLCVSQAPKIPEVDYWTNQHQFCTCQLFLYRSDPVKDSLAPDLPRSKFRSPPTLHHNLTADILANSDFAFERRVCQAERQTPDYLIEQ